MRTVTTIAYVYPELNAEAQAKARDWFKTGLEFDSEFVLDDAAQIAAILGIELNSMKSRATNTEKFVPVIHFSGFGSKTDGASFEGRYRYKQDALEKIKQYAPRDTELHAIADGLATLSDIASAPFVVDISLRHGSRYYNSSMMEFEFVSGTSLEEDFKAVEHWLRVFATWIYRQLEQQYNDQFSDEGVADAIIANKYEFDEKGARI